jgi:hypothetical protein
LNAIPFQSARDKDKSESNKRTFPANGTHGDRETLTKPVITT